MKIYEIICEDTSAEDQLSHDNLAGNLLPVLMFLKKRSEEKNLSPTMRTDSLIQMVKNAGDTSFNYDSLQSAMQNNQAVGNLIKNLTPEDVEITGQTGQEGDEDDEIDDSEAPEMGVEPPAPEAPEGVPGQPGAAMAAPAQPAPMQVGPDGQMFAPPTPQQTVSNMAAQALNKRK